MNKSALVAALFLFASGSAAAQQNSGVTPYGDYCKEFSAYGFCRGALPPQEAIVVLEKYYRHKGLRVVILAQRGRFILADIYHHFRPVDKIIFDTRTGRLRSIN